MDNTQSNQHLLEEDREKSDGKGSGSGINEKIASSYNNTETMDSPEKTISFRKTKFRWIALVFACFMLLGSYFCYDNPNALSDQLKKYVTHDGKNDVKYNQLYSIYSYPNIILPLFGGILIDKVGLNFATILFSLLLVLGQGVFTISGYMGTTDKSDNWPFIVALAGRFIFGLGGESLNVCQSVSVGRWFRGQELSLALGLNISVSRLGSVFNNYSMPPIADGASLGTALTFGFIICVISFISGIVLTFLETRAQKVDHEDGALKEDEKEEFHWSDIREFSFAYWLIVANCIFTYIGIFCFNNVSNDFFTTRYGFNQTQAGRITSNVFLISAFLAPIFGYVADRFGNKVSFTILSGACLTLCHVLFIIIPSSTKTDKSYLGIIPIILMGVTYSIYVAAIWPMVIIAVKPHVVGSAYGLCTAVQNIGLALGPVMVGGLTFNGKDEDKFLWVNVALGSFAFLGFLSGIGLLIRDKTTHKGMLNAKITTEGNEEDNRETIEKLDSDLKPYVRDENVRTHVKRSIAKSSMAK